MNKKTRRLLTISLCFSITLANQAGIATPAFAAVQPGNTVSINDQSSDYIPLRMLCDWIGTPVQWDRASRTVTVTKGEEKVRFHVENDGRASANVSGNITPIEHGMMIRNGVVYMKQETLKHTLGIQAYWAEGKLQLDPDDAISRANAFLTQLAKGNIEDAYVLTSRSFSSAGIPPETIEWTKQLALFPKSWGTVTTNAVHKTVTIVYQTPQMALDLEVRLDQSGRVDDLYTNLHFYGYQPPAYDKQKTYTEQQIMVGQGDHAVTGILTLPQGKGPFPAVILIQGDGELDANSTILAQKPFRDLAVGLAGRHIAVLRMTKTTREHFVQLSGHYTAEDEFVDNTLQAAKLLQENAAIDSNRIFATGHSRGGWMLPRILSRDSEQRITGAIVLAGADPRYTEIDSYDHPELGGMIPDEELAYTANN
ncbi:stalk domain-containing protein [Paenibacillus caui]|uniref:alpha/beta hydrolase family protein n=1 Tax=Paenibacillus caui TaxID=2873927 RepID=UPI001CA90FD6|nr:stalk domain-containing protein [Paenibacillus caui]